MAYSKVHELEALVEILETAQLDLHRLLVADHVPFDVGERIAKERKTITDIEYLIRDIQADIALNELKKEYMKIYSGINKTAALAI